MAHLLVIQTDEGVEKEVEVERRLTRIGSHPQCEVRVDHPEVGEHVANVDCRSAVCMFQNRAPYDVYVGETRIAPQAWSEWPSGTPIQLTRSVALGLKIDPSAVEGAQVPALNTDNTEERRATESESKKVLQLGVIAVCLIAAVVTLSGGDTQEVSSDQSDGFQVLVDALDMEGATEDQQKIKRYLQEAYMADVRPNRFDPARASRAYELLLHHETIWRAALDRSTLEGRVKLFAEQRLAELTPSG